MQMIAMKLGGKLARNMLQMFMQIRDLEKQVNIVLHKVPPKPSGMRRRWENFKIAFYKCFGRCQEDEIPDDSTFDQMFYDGTEPNEQLKLFLGYFGALLMSTLLCIFFVFKYPWSPWAVGLICGVVAMILSYMMFFRIVRCWFLLMMPELFSNRIRAILILLALSWTMIGPAANVQLNMRATSEMLACIQEQVNKEGATIKSAMKNSLKARAEYFIQAKRNIERTLKEAKDKLKSVYNAFVRMGKVVKKLFKWLDSLVDLCNTEAITPYENCVDWWTVLKKDCYSRWYAYTLCGVLNGGSLVNCLWYNFKAILCAIPAAIAKAIKEHVLERIKTSLDAAVKRLEETFEFDVEIKRNVSYQEKFESNMSYFRDEIQRQIENAQWWYQLTSYIFDAFIFISFAFMLFKAIRYQRKYLSNPRQDNYFLTAELTDADRQRIRLSKETVLPLTYKETKLYIVATSIGFTTREKWKLCRPIFTTTSSLLFIIFWIQFDIILWKVMTEQYVMLMEEGGVDVPNYYKLHVQGTGTMANAFRSLLHAFVPQNDNEGDLSKKWQKCIIEPSVPDFELNKNLYVMMGVCYVTIVFKVYLDRLRHAVCFLFYPDQEKKRAAELQNQILIMRGSWAYFAQKQIANRKSSKVGVAGAAIQRVAASVPLLGKLIRMMADEMKLCFECNERIKVEDLENYRACENPTCGQTFCSDCYYRCPECQSCGENKVPRGLFIDHELPHMRKEEEKPTAIVLKEKSLLDLYDAEHLRPSEEAIRSSSRKSQLSSARPKWDPEMAKRSPEMAKRSPKTAKRSLEGVKRIQIRMNPLKMSKYPK